MNKLIQAAEGSAMLENLSQLLIYDNSSQKLNPIIYFLLSNHSSSVDSIFVFRIVDCDYFYEVKVNW